MNHTQRHIAHYVSRSIIDIHTDHPVLVGIDGKDASGKTTFADTLAATLRSHTGRQIIRVSLDNFFQPRAVRTRQADQARGCYEDTFDNPGIIQYLLDPIKINNTYAAKIFDYKSDSAVEIITETASSDAIVIIDGVFLQRPEFRSYWNYTILLEVSDETAIERGARRDTERIGDRESARQKYINRYIASQKIYYDECSPRDNATIIIDNTNYMNPTVA